MSRRLVDGKQPTRVIPEKAGRTSNLELDDTIETKILNSLRIGANVNTAGAFAGVSYDALRTWVLKGKENPDSRYGAFIKKVEKAIAEHEMGDLAVIHAHANGRPAQYEMEVVRDHDGKIIYESPGKPLMQIARDGNDNPILKSSEIRSDWRAAMDRMSRRFPRYWSRTDLIDVQHNHDSILTLDSKKAESKEALSFEQRVEAAMKKIRADIYEDEDDDE